VKKDNEFRNIVRNSTDHFLNRSPHLPIAVARRIVNLQPKLLTYLFHVTINGSQQCAKMPTKRSSAYTTLHFYDNNKNKMRMRLGIDRDLLRVNNLMIHCDIGSIIK
jgi:pyruvate carboxylase